MICAPSKDSDRHGHPSSLIKSLRCPHEETLGPKLPIERTAKTLIRLGGSPGWSESSLGAQSFCWFCHQAAHTSQISLFLWHSSSTVLLSLSENFIPKCLSILASDSAICKCQLKIQYAIHHVWNRFASQSMMRSLARYHCGKSLMTSDRHSELLVQFRESDVGCNTLDFIMTS